ncbi:hypothetical protein ACRAWF_15870 [Streptomyces sp. L7]
MPGPAGRPWTARELAAHARVETLALGARFDERNGTTHVGDRARARMDQRPLVERLPLGVRSAGRPATAPVTVPAPEPTPEKDLSALLAEARRLSDTLQPHAVEAWLAVARAAEGVELAALDRAEIADHQAMDQGPEGIALFEHAAELYTEAGDPGEALAARARGAYRTGSHGRGRRGPRGDRRAVRRGARPVRRGRHGRTADGGRADEPGARPDAGRARGSLGRLPRRRGPGRRRGCCPGGAGPGRGAHRGRMSGWPRGVPRGRRCWPYSAARTGDLEIGRPAVREGFGGFRGGGAAVVRGGARGPVGRARPSPRGHRGGGAGAAGRPGARRAVSGGAGAGAAASSSSPRCSAAGAGPRRRLSTPWRPLTGPTRRARASTLGRLGPAPAGRLPAASGAVGGGRGGAGVGAARPERRDARRRRGRTDEVVARGLSERAGRAPHAAAERRLQAAEIARHWPEQHDHATLAHLAAESLGHAGLHTEADQAYTRGATCGGPWGTCTGWCVTLRARAWLALRADQGARQRAGVDVGRDRGVRGGPAGDGRRGGAAAAHCSELGHTHRQVRRAAGPFGRRGGRGQRDPGRVRGRPGADRARQSPSSPPSGTAPLRTRTAAELAAELAGRRTSAVPATRRHARVAC